jgi:hypothetical protein
MILVAGSGIVRLAPENSAALWRGRFKNSLFRFIDLKVGA